MVTRAVRKLCLFCCVTLDTYISYLCNGTNFLYVTNYCKQYGGRYPLYIPSARMHVSISTADPVQDPDPEFVLNPEPDSDPEPGL